MHLQKVTPIQHILCATFLLLIFIGSCNPAKKPETQTSPPAASAACYLFLQGRDSIMLSLENREGVVAGRLRFSFYEKDKSRGTIDGEMRGDTLFANYIFTSEGMLSYREVAFLKKENSFVLGSGEIVNSGNTDVFKNRNEVAFNTGVVLSRVNCHDIE